MYEFINDKVAIEDAQAGNSDAFTFLVLKYQRRLYLSMLTVTSDPGLAEDITQEAFVRAYVKISTFKFESQFFTWLYRIAYNNMLTKVRARGGRQMAQVSTDEMKILLEELSADHSRLDEAMDRRETGEWAHKALDELSPHQRRILRLREIDGYSYEDIAEILGIKVGTVRSQLHRTRAYFKKALFQHGADFLPEIADRIPERDDVTVEDIKRLPWKDRAILILRIVDEYGYERLAEEFECTVEQAKYKFARAGRRLMKTENY